MRFFILYIFLIINIEADKANVKHLEGVDIAIKKSLKVHRLKSNFIYDIIHWESNYNANVISVFGNRTDKKRAKKLKRACIDLSFLLRQTSLSCSENFLRIYPATYKEVAMIDSYLRSTTLNYDVGLMQINKENISSLNLTLSELVLNYKLNIDKGILLLKQCHRAMRGDTKKAIECYNKGTNESKFGDYEYYSRILNLNKKRMRLN